ncbi:hypothetical protein V499_00303 [Pseudogymnoascus sp. VKM F-103]|nr:hypothetical protein V499_00303 [Pseudogymnoascus sp. VKM F-103]
MSKRKPSVLPSNISSTRDLCDFLGFYGTEAKNDLCDFSRKWRMAYTTRSGCAGTKLLNWKFEQEELKIMAQAFLSDAVEEEFWSNRKGGDSIPKGSDEETVNLLMQLLWKQNKYAYNNANYPKPSQDRIRRIGATQYNDQQTKRRKRDDGIFIAYDHDGFMERATEQSSLSQQFSPAPPPLAPLQTDTAALPPTESQSPPHVQHVFALTTEPKGRVPIPFHISLYSGGKTRQSFWEEGRFGSKSLQEFLPSFAAKLKCAPNDIERIKLVLRLKTRDVEIEMEARNEDIWEIAMATFRDEIKRGKAKGEVKGVSVLVEPVMRKGGVETGGWDEDEEFEL